MWGRVANIYQFYTKQSFWGVCFFVWLVGWLVVVFGFCAIRLLSILLQSSKKTLNHVVLHVVPTLQAVDEIQKCDKIKFFGNTIA